MTKAIESVLEERKRQDEKWGSQRRLPASLWMTILGEEFGESCEAALERQPENLRKELVQVAAVAVAAVEALDSGFFER